MDNSQKVLQKTKQLKDKVEAFNSLVSKWEDTLVLIDLANEENDESMLPDVVSATEEIEADIDKMTLETLLSGHYDKNNAIMTFHAGAGGTEAQDWCEMLIRMYQMWAQKNGYTATVLDSLPGDEAGIKSCTIEIDGLNAYGYLKAEKGVHRLVRISPFNSAGKRMTSFASIEVMPELDDNVEVDIRPEDIKMEAFRASGAGGQHINKTSSAIRITHLPTGMVVECQDERSQYKNKDKALKVLKSRLLKEKQDKQASEIAENRKMQVGTGDRSERIRTYNYPQGRVTDHRIGLTLYKLEEILNGSLDEVIDALVAADRAEKLKESMEK